MGKKRFKNPNLVQSSGRVSLPDMTSLDGSIFNYPIFCFKHLHKEHDFENCCKAHPKFLKGFVHKIKMLSDLNWDTIKLSDKRANGSEKISRNSLKVPLPTSITKDVQDVFSFRFSGEDGRIIGYRNDNVFHVIYIDTILAVYKH